MKIKIDIEEFVNNKFKNSTVNRAPLMKDLSLMALSAIQKNIESGIGPDNRPLTKEVKRGDKTLRDSGKLRASLTARHTESEAAVGTNVPYARVHNPENGQTETVISAKNGKSLAIPASAKTRTLQRKYGFSAREVIAGLQAKKYSVYRPYKKGTRVRSNVIMAKKKGEAAFAVFILKKSVKIPARPFMFLSDAVIAALEKRVSDYYEA